MFNFSRIRIFIIAILIVELVPHVTANEQSTIELPLPNPKTRIDAFKGILFFGTVDAIPANVKKNITSKNGDDKLIELLNGRDDWKEIVFTAFPFYVTDKGLKEIAKCKGLTKLMLSVSPEIGDEAVIHIAENCENLEMLFLNIVPDVIHFDFSWNNCPHYFWIGAQSRIGDKGLSALAKCRKLHSLGLSVSGDVTDDGVASILRSISSLRSFTLHGADQLTDIGIADILKDTKLVDLILPGSPLIGDQTAKQIASMPTMEQVCFSTSAFFTDEGLLALESEGLNLKMLDFNNATSVPPEAVLRFLKKRRHVSVYSPFIKQVRGISVESANGDRYQRKNGEELRSERFYQRPNWQDSGK